MSLKPLLFLAPLLFPIFSKAQNGNDTGNIQKRNIPTLQIVSSPQTPTLKDYKLAATRKNDLVYTQLKVRFDFDSCFLYGEEWVTLQPHFYPQDSLLLDAKGMEIQTVALVIGRQTKKLKYKYDQKELRIALDKTYQKEEPYTLYIKYVARPNAYAAASPGGSASVTSDKGLFFINPQHKDKYKPTEVWSMGYPESNSVWFPTIDKPDQKSTAQITITVPDTLTTFSNGILINQKKHARGMRSDTWKMRYPNAPYLYTIAAGPFEVVNDHWKNIPVRYFVEKKYVADAKAIFGHTPEMIAYFSKILRTPYPWKSYDQVVVRDFITGAMENTTATMHGEALYKTKRQLQDDGYRNESVIAHELFHQWFGDLVTCKSWSNITLNESFGDYGEMLWAAYKYGEDLADQHSYEAMQRYFYFADTHEDHPLVWHYYPDKEDVLDAVAYQKGGRILNMLRNYVGDSAFFASLHYYLEKNKFSSAEAVQLKLAFEKVTGRDMSLFWNQWYYRKGYPSLAIRYQYDEGNKIVRVIVRQIQEEPVFMLPFAIDVYEGGRKEHHKVIMMQRIDTFSFHYAVKPDLINVDGDKVLLAKFKDHRPLASYIYQYKYAGKYLDRREAIDTCSQAQDSSLAARKLLLAALNDPFYGLRKRAIQSLDLKNPGILHSASLILKKLLFRDKHSSVRSAALVALTAEEPDLYKKEVLQALMDTSLEVESTALGILNDMAPREAYKQAKKLQAIAEAPLSQTICTIYAQQGYVADFDYVNKWVHETGSFDKFNYLNAWFHMLGTSVTENAVIKKELSSMIDFVKVIGPRYGYYIVGLLNDFINEKRKASRHATGEELKVRLKKQAEFGRQILSEVERLLE